MKKTITILSALAITGSPALALNIVNHKTQNFQNIIINPATSKSNVVVNNNIIVQSVSCYHFYFQARLSNSTYNGFPGYLNQIDTTSTQSFFQWLNDNNFGNYFPDLNQFTQHGFFHDPMVWSNRLEEHMGHFGAFYDNKSATAYDMIHGTNYYKYLSNFVDQAEEAYNQAAATGKVAGIMINFGFLYKSVYTVEKPNFVVIMNP